MIFVRIDDRLVHGQVVQGWLPFLDAAEVVVVSDAAAGDEMRKTLMRMSLPSDVCLTVLGVATAAEYLKKAGSRSDNILALAAGPGDIFRLAEAGVSFSSVNVGGMHYSVGKAQMGRALFMSDEDIRSLKALAARGIKLEGRGVPTDEAEDVATALVDTTRTRRAGA
ncbi:MAG: PTS sugar transporter subunit IIB [Elusimicrobiales bacterium]|nr:PTS sugar transporter subunit IIB [Elusimicrobiales bacterium]